MTIRTEGSNKTSSETLCSTRREGSSSDSSGGKGLEIFWEVESKGLMTRYGRRREGGGKNGCYGPGLEDWVDSSDSLLENTGRGTCLRGKIIFAC